MKPLTGVLATLLALGLGSVNQAQADPTDQALSQWLAGQEESALTVLSRQAHGGQARAQLALGLIDADPLYHGPWLMAQDRRTRIALLRQPGGISGRSWLRDLAHGSAPLWLSAWDGDATADILADFLKLGEDRAALAVALRLANRQKRGFDGLALAADSPVWLRLLAARDRVAAGQGEMSIPKDLSPGDPTFHHFLGGPLPDAPVLANWLGRDALAAPIRSYCAELCTDQAPVTCHLGLFAAIGGFPALARVRSPSPDLIAEDRFAASMVAHQMLDQLVADGNENARRTKSDGPECSK